MNEHIRIWSSDFVRKQTFRTAQTSHTSQDNWPNLAESWPPNLRPVMPYWHHEYKHKLLGFSKEKNKHFVLQYFSTSSLDFGRRSKLLKYVAPLTVGRHLFMAGAAWLISHISAWFPLTQLFSPSVSSGASVHIRCCVHGYECPSIRTRVQNYTAVSIMNLSFSCRKVARRDGSLSWTAGASAWVQERLGVRWDVLITKKKKIFRDGLKQEVTNHITGSLKTNLVSSLPSFQSPAVKPL